MDLIDAVMESNVDKVKEFLEEGSDPNFYEDMVRVRPIHFAAQRQGTDALEVMKLLIAAGADPKAETDDGVTAIDLAISLKNDAMIKFLLKLPLQSNFY